MDLNAKMQKAREAGYSDQQINAYLGQNSAKPVAPKPKIGGVKGALLNFLPTATSAIGATIGTAIAPGAGTAVGGAGGGAIGEYLRQRITGEAEDGIDKGNIIQEGAFGAIPGVLKGAKMLKGAKSAKLASDALEAEKLATDALLKAEQFASKSAKVGSGAGKLATISEASAGLDDAVSTARRTKAGSITGKLATRSEANKGMEDALRQIEDAKYSNQLAKQNIERLAEEQSRRGIMLGESGNSGVMVKSGSTPSFASEGIELQKLPSTPYVPSGSVPMTAPKTPLPFVPKTTKMGVPKPPVTNVAPQSTEASLLSRKSMTLPEKAQSSLSSSEAKNLGIEVGSNNRGRPMLPSDVDELIEFKTSVAPQYGGIKAGKPINQARDAENVLTNVKSKLTSQRASINRPITNEERQQIIDSIRQRVSNDASITGTTKQADKLIEKVGRAKSVDDIENIRMEADDIAYKKSGDAKTTSSASQAVNTRQAIDDFVAPLSTEYAETKRHYGLAKTLAESTAKNSKTAKGVKVPFVGIEVGQQSIPGAKNKLVEMAQKIVSDRPPVDPTSGYRPFIGATAKNLPSQVGTRVAGTAFGIPFVGGEQQEQAPVDELNFEEDIVADTPEQTQGGAFQDVSKVEEAYFKALSGGDTKTADAILKGYEIFGGGGKSAKPMSAEASKTVSNAQAGLEAINSLKSTISSDPSALSKTAIPGRGLFSGAVGSALGTGSIDADRQQIIDVIARLRTGAAISQAEEERFQKFIPQAFDSPEVQDQKLGYLERQFARVAQRSGGAGTDLESAVAQ